MHIKSIREAKNLKERRVFLRSDFNVPIVKGKILDDYKLISSLPTIRFLLSNKCKIIIGTHLGSPKGKSSAFSTKPIALRLGRMLGKKIKFVNDCIGAKVEKEIEKMKDGEILFLENLRFYKEEKKNKKSFAKKLARLADIYVNDAFGVSHRKHASVSAIRKYLPHYAGLLMEKEILNLNKILHPSKPFVVVMGGAKIATKLQILERFEGKADYILLGGSLANTLLSILGYEVGKSRVETDDMSLTHQLISFYKRCKNKKVILPLDFAVSQSKDGKGNAKIKTLGNVDKKDYIFDIGPKTISFYAKFIKKGNTIVWNGPLGMFENSHFKHGTISIARTIAARSTGAAFGVAGGGETVEALKATHMMDYVDWVSTGGGAMLSYLNGEKMPGLKGIVRR